MTEKQATQLFEKWRKALHLEAWDIKFQWKVRDRDMNLSESLGCTTGNHVSRQAIIQMLDPQDFHNPLFEYNYEKVLVHELLHLVFMDIDDSGDPLRDKLLHQLIDDLSKVLVDVSKKEDK